MRQARHLHRDAPSVNSTAGTLGRGQTDTPTDRNRRRNRRTLDHERRLAAVAAMTIQNRPASIATARSSSSSQFPLSATSSGDSYGFRDFSSELLPPLRTNSSGYRGITTPGHLDRRSTSSTPETTSPALAVGTTSMVTTSQRLLGRLPSLDPNFGQIDTQLSDPGNMHLRHSSFRSDTFDSDLENMSPASDTTNPFSAMEFQRTDHDAMHSPMVLPTYADATDGRSGWA